MVYDRETPLSELFAAVAADMDLKKIALQNSPYEQNPDFQPYTLAESEAVKMALEVYKTDMQTLFVVGRSTVGTGYVLKGMLETAFPQRKIGVRIINPKVTFAEPVYSMNARPDPKRQSGIDALDFAFHVTGEADPTEEDKKRVREMWQAESVKKSIDATRHRIAKSLADCAHTWVPDLRDPMGGRPLFDTGVPLDEGRLARIIDNYGRSRIGRYGILDHEVVNGRAMSKSKQLLQIYLATNPRAERVWASGTTRYNPNGMFFHFDPLIYAKDKYVPTLVHKNEAIPGIRERVEVGREIGRKLRARIEAMGLPDWDRTDAEIDASGEPTKKN